MFTAWLGVGPAEAAGIAALPSASGPEFDLAAAVSPPRPFSWGGVGPTEAYGIAALSSKSGPESEVTATISPTKRGPEGVVARATHGTPPGRGSMV